MSTGSAHRSDTQGLLSSALFSSSHASFLGQKKNSVSGLLWLCGRGKQSLGQPFLYALLIRDLQSPRRFEAL